MLSDVGNASEKEAAESYRGLRGPPKQHRGEGEAHRRIHTGWPRHSEWPGWHVHLAFVAKKTALILSPF